MPEGTTPNIPAGLVFGVPPFRRNPGIQHSSFPSDSMPPGGGTIGAVPRLAGPITAGDRPREESQTKFVFFRSGRLAPAFRLIYRGVNFALEK